MPTSTQHRLLSCVSKAVRGLAPAPMQRAMAGVMACTAMLGIAVAQQGGGSFVVPTTPMPGPRAFHGSAVLGHYYYALGGQVGGTEATEKPTASVVRARVNPDGTLGAWEETTALPAPRLYINNSTIVLNDVVYIVGGADAAANGSKYRTAIFSRPLPNGALMPWSESQPFGDSGLSQFVSVSTPGHIHVIGGYDESRQVRKEVWSNSIYADGSMGAWSPGPPLPVPLWFHSAGVAGGRVYTWGGVPTADANQGSSARVFSAPIQGSGRLGVWREESPGMPKPYYTASNAVAGTYLMAICPRYGPQAYGSDIWFTSVTPSGLGQWGMRTANIPNRVYHAAATDYRAGVIYISGGRPTRDDDQLAEQFMLRLSPQVRAMAEQGWVAAERAHANTVSASPVPGQAAGGGELTYVAAQRLSSGAVAGFKTYDTARMESLRQRLPLVLYFNLANAKPCVEQMQMLQAPEFATIAKGASFAWVDTGENPQLAQQLGIYRVPTWVFYDASGDEVAGTRAVGTVTVPQLSQMLLRLKK